VTPNLLLTQGDELIGRLWVAMEGYSSSGFEVRWRFEATPEFEQFRTMFDRDWGPDDLQRYHDWIRESGLAIKDANGAGYRWIFLTIRGPWAYSRGLRPIKPEDPELVQARVHQAIELLVAEVHREIAPLPEGHPRTAKLEAIIRWLRGSN